MGASPGLPRRPTARTGLEPVSSRACAWMSTGRAGSGPTSAPIPGPKEDRLRLTRATRANLSPIFTLFPDPEGIAERAIERGRR